MATLIDANQAMFTPFEPKLKNRFIMNIEGIDAYLIKTYRLKSRSFLPFTKFYFHYCNDFTKCYI